MYTIESILSSKFYRKLSGEFILRTLLTLTNTGKNTEENVCSKDIRLCQG